MMDKVFSKVKLMKKDTLCSYYKNCKYRDQCEFYHPAPENKQRIKQQNGSKNWQEEMQEGLHFLTKEMKRMAKEMQEMKMTTRRK